MKKKQMRYPLQPSLIANKGVCEFALAQATAKKMTNGVFDSKKFINYFLSLIAKVIYLAHGAKSGNTCIALLAKHCYEFCDRNFDKNDFEVEPILRIIDGNMTNINSLNTDQVRFARSCMIVPTTAREIVVQTYVKGVCCLDLGKIIKYYAAQAKLIKSGKAKRTSTILVVLAGSTGVSPLINGLYRSMLIKSSMDIVLLRNLVEYSYYVAMLHDVLHDMMLIRLKREITTEHAFKIISKYFFMEGVMLKGLNLLEEYSLDQAASLSGIFKQGEYRYSLHGEHEGKYGAIASEVISLWEAGDKRNHSQMLIHFKEKYAGQGLDDNYLKNMLGGLGGKYGKKLGGTKRRKGSW